MSDTLPTVVVAAAMATAVGLGIAALVGRRPGRAELAVVGILEGLLLLATAVLVVGLVQGANEGSAGIILVYALGTLAVMPLAVVWALGEPSRWSNAVLAAGGLVVAVLVLRLDQIWTGG